MEEFLRALNNLANAYSVHGDYDKAIRTYTECLSKRGELFGLDSIEYLRPKLALARTYYKANRYEEGISIAVECIEPLRRLPGQEQATRLAQQLLQGMVQGLRG